MCFNPFGILPWYVSRVVVVVMLYLHFTSIILVLIENKSFGILLLEAYKNFDNVFMLFIWSCVLFLIK